MLIAGNWKMNTRPDGAVALASEVVNGTRRLTARGNSTVGVAVCPPAVSLMAVHNVVSGTAVKLGAQNMHEANHGAYTGENSGGMLKAVGCTYVILGHSERRQYFCETDESVNRKIKTALSFDLVPIVCVGESLEQREQGRHREVVKTQLDRGFDGIESDSIRPVIAYEPVWAIGTGHTATPEEAQDMHSFIRSWLTDRYGAGIAGATELLYGGSLKPGNAPDLLSQSDIDGGLIGGASLKADDFVDIIRTAIDVTAS